MAKDSAAAVVQLTITPAAGKTLADYNQPNTGPNHYFYCLPAGLDNTAVTTSLINLTYYGSGELASVAPHVYFGECKIRTMAAGASYLAVGATILTAASALY